MSRAFYCLDNDIILKLATCNVFDETLKTFDANASQVKILDTFKYKFQKQIQRTKGNRATSNPQYNIQKALEITQSFATISESDTNNFDTSIYTHRTYATGTLRSIATSNLVLVAGVSGISPF